MKTSLQQKQLKRFFVSQQETSDCGVACLLSLIKYYGGSNDLENLRRLSGTNVSGTTLLGLQRAVLESGFSAFGCEADVHSIIDYGKPAILHVVLDGIRQHYIVLFGVDSSRKKGEKILIGDPAQSILALTKEELEKLWLSKTCLILEPNENFTKKEAIAEKKKDWIKKFLKTDYPMLLIAAGIGIGISLLSLAMALFSQKLIDEILPKKEFEKLYLGVALVLLLLLVKECLSFLRQTLLVRQGRDFNIRIIKHLYAHLLQLSKPFFDTRKIGDLTARLNDTARIQRVISQIAGSTIIDVLTAIVTVCFLFFYSWKVASACLCFFPIYFFLIYSHNKKITESQRDVMASYAASESNYIATLQGIETIKNFQKQTTFEGINKNVYQSYQNNIVRLGSIQIRLSFIANSLGILFLVSVLAFCSYSVLHNQMTTGELMALLGMSSSLLPSVTNLALLSIPINEAKIAFDRMFEFTNSGIESIEKATGQKKIFTSLQIKNISFRFAGRKQLLQNVSFDLSRGEIVAIVGENGSGKSTLTQILQRHYTIETGQIILNEEYPCENIPLEEWRALTGCVSQQAHIFNSTVLENIAFEDAVDKTEKVLQFLDEYGFTALIDSLLQSYNTLVGEEGINLSGGQKQLIAFARALYRQPQLLILDEATASMDRQTEKFVMQLLLKLKYSMAIVFITHKLHMLFNFADHIYVLENGRTVANGKHEELLISANNLYAEYWADL